MPEVNILDAARIWYNKTARGDGPSAGGPAWDQLSFKKKAEAIANMMAKTPREFWQLKYPITRAYIHGEPVLNVGEETLPNPPDALPRPPEPEYVFGTGVPYFALARQHNADYGLVLTYSDMLEDRPVPSHAAALTLAILASNIELALGIWDVFKAEQLRRLATHKVP